MNKEMQLNALSTYFDLMAMNGGSRVFHLARQLGIFDALASGPSSSKSVAETCGLQQEPLSLVLDTLCSLRTLNCQDGSYTLAPVMHFLAGNYQNLSDEYWDHLPELLKTGEPIARMDDSEQSEEQYRKQVSALAWMMEPSAEALSGMLGIGDQRKGLEILDVGAGSAVWSLSCALKDPTSKVTALDWPAVLKIARASAESLGIGNRFSGLAGNYHQVELPRDRFDLALVANVTHLETPDGNRALFRKLRKALKPGGEIVVIDVMPGQDQGKLARSLYALGLALRTESGQVFSVEQLQAFLLQSDFNEPQFSPLKVCPHTMGMIVAQKEKNHAH